jgi:hypothetical protein
MPMNTDALATHLQEFHSSEEKNMLPTSCDSIILPLTLEFIGVQDHCPDSAHNWHHSKPASNSQATKGNLHSKSLEIMLN